MSKKHHITFFTDLYICIFVTPLKCWPFCNPIPFLISEFWAVTVLVWYFHFRQVGIFHTEPWLQTIANFSTNWAFSGQVNKIGNEMRLTSEKGNIQLERNLLFLCRSWWFCGTIYHRYCYGSMPLAQDGIFEHTTNISCNLILANPWLAGLIVTILGHIGLHLLSSMHSSIFLYMFNDFFAIAKCIMVICTMYYGLQKWSVRQMSQRDC